MSSFEAWLATRGSSVAVAINEREDSICKAASAHFAEQHETLLLDLSRPDAQAFQQMAFKETPRRLHRLLQVALRFQTLAVIEREYRWSWGILPRYGITLRHMLSMVRSYFDAVRALGTFDQTDRHFVEVFERQVLEAIEHSAPLAALRHHQPYQSYIGNNHRSNGNRLQ